jgi:hypothetical protein
MGHGGNGVGDRAATRPTGAERTDAALLSAVAGGERDAFADLYARHAPWLQV